ncbi:MAG: hypothetical protein ACLPXM_01645 [Terriglobales bacterium]
MTITPDEYRQKLTEAFQPDVLKGLMLGVAQAYRTTAEHCKRQYDAPDRHDVIGTVRRAGIHEAVRGVAERFQLDFADEPNANGSHYFLSVFSGEIRLICNLVSTRRKMVRAAKIRKVWARYNFNAQYHMFDNGSAPPPNWKYLAILVHSPLGRHRNEAAFVDIVVPDLKFTQYMTRLDLFKEFPAEAEGYRSLFKRRRFGAEAEGA